MRSRNVILTLFFVLAFLVYLFFKMRRSLPVKKLILQRNFSRIDYVSRALCQMDCYHISANDITTILKRGSVKKILPASGTLPCPIFVVGGLTRNGKNLVIAVRQCGKVLRIISCESPDIPAACNCPGEETDRVI
jgi:hypothetical protein